MSLASDALLATTGLLPKAVTPKEISASAAVLDTWTRRMRQFVRKDEQAAFEYRPPVDLEKLFSKLVAPLDEIDVAPWLASFGDDLVAGAEYVESLRRARKYLVDAWPAVHYETQAGQKILPLSPDDEHEVWSLFQVLDDPDRLIAEMEQQTLTVTQAAAFRDCYPDLYQFADQALNDAMAELVAKDMDWAPSLEKEAVIRVFRGLPPEEEMVPPPPPPQPQAELKIEVDRDKTQAEVSSEPR